MMTIATDATIAMMTTGTTDRRGRRSTGRRARPSRRSRRRAVSVDLDDASGEPVPRWGRRFPGRFRREMEAFEKAGVRPAIHREALVAGRVELAFDWPLDGRRLPLKAIYPD